MDIVENLEAYVIIAALVNSQLLFYKVNSVIVIHIAEIPIVVIAVPMSMSIFIIFFITNHLIMIIDKEYIF